MAVTVITVGSRCSLLLSCVACLSADPTLMVRTDIQGKFRDHLYTYEPADVEACEWPSTLSDDKFGGGKTGGRRECCTPYLSGTWRQTEPSSCFLITSIFWQMTKFFCEKGLTERTRGLVWVIIREVCRFWVAAGGHWKVRLLLYLLCSFKTNAMSNLLNYRNKKIYLVD